MPDIIELLSSSPPEPRVQSGVAPLQKTGLNNGIFSFGSDDFDSTGDLDFLIEQSAKRQRLTPPPVLSDLGPSLRASKDGVYEFSSEPDTLPDIDQIALPVELSGNDVKDDFLVDDDSIFRFSSSAPEPSIRRHQKETFILDLSSDPEPPIGDPVQSSSQPGLSSRPIFSERTANLLAGLHSNMDITSRKAKVKAKSRRSMSVDITVNRIGKFKQISKPSSHCNDDSIDSSQPLVAKQSSIVKRPDEIVSNSKPSQATSKADKAAEKEAEQERKRLEKERKAQEKQRAADIAEVNKSKTNKKNSTSEMIVDMPASLQNLSVGNQVEEYMKQLNVQVTFSRDEEVNLMSDSDVSLGNIIRWRRKVTADFDEDLEIWKPLPQPRITRENHITVYLKAEEFVNIAVIGNSTSVTSAVEISDSTMRVNLDDHIKLLRANSPNITIIYLIEGLSAWNRKSANLKNKAYTAAVRSQHLEDENNDNDKASSSTAPAPTQPRRGAKRKRPSKPQIDLSSVNESTTELLLLHLQLHHQPLRIHHTTSPATTAAQITALTQHLSTRPYRLAEQNHNLASASFCMATGQIRTGATPHETYINMLQEVNRVTPSMAYGISGAGFKNVAGLVRGFREKGNLMLQDVKKSVNKDGGWSDRRLGPMVSKRLYRVFTGRDPGARDGIA